MRVKYMLMMFGDGASMMRTHTGEWVTEMIQFMQEFNERTAHSGELIEARGLADPSHAKTVSLVDGQVVVSDGPFAEAKESLAGFWVLNVADEARVVELAGEVVQWAERVEIREVPDAPPEG
jgi:hypothetical protein